MKLRRLLFLATVCYGLVLFHSGCSQRPSRAAAPDWEPSDFSGVILEKLDKNGDSLVDEIELAPAPGLKSGAKAIDSNQDGKLSGEELEARFTTYRDLRVGLAPKEFRVTYNGRPLADAEVRLVPEFFLVDIVEPATGTTDNLGIVRPAIPNQDLALMRVGYYRVEVTSPRVKLPEQFNTATTVGVELPAYSKDPATLGTIEIALRDK